MPKGHDKRHLAFAFLIFRGQFFKEFIETEGRKKTKELIEEASLTQAIDFGDIFSGGEICGNARPTTINCADATATSSPKAKKSSHPFLPGKMASVDGVSSYL